MVMINRTKLASAGDMAVTVGGRPLCVTSNSRWLDPQINGRKQYDGRNDAAERIALCWNACRHLSDAELSDSQGERP